MDVMPALREFVSNQLLQREVCLSEHTELIAEGYLTSLQTVELVMFLSRRFGVEVEPEEVNEQNFRSLATIESLVQRKLARV